MLNGGGELCDTIEGGCTAALRSCNVADGGGDAAFSGASSRPTSLDVATMDRSAALSEPALASPLSVRRAASVSALSSPVFSLGFSISVEGEEIPKSRASRGRVSALGEDVVTRCRCGFFCCFTCGCGDEDGEGAAFAAVFRFVSLCAFVTGF